ncbi:MAG: SigE family RNA polymerase sigma factor [Dermatophilus congolensis]|nr:SigE family RNA polymerase sigma factor [Dermatophilus congolensis]
MSVEVSLDEFYERTYPRLVATLTLLTGSRADAEEIAQEAFIRLIPRWEKVRLYEDPEGWLRTTARRLATSRWRRAVVAAKALPILASRSDQRPGGETRSSSDVELDVDLARWLAKVTPAHREVLVLHHALDMSVEEIATELGISVGTVKSRLHRARAAVRAEAAPDQPDATQSPDTTRRGETP